MIPRVVPLRSELSKRLQTCIPCFYDTVLNETIQVQIPNDELSDEGLTTVHIRSEDDLKHIPNCEGNYWILTNEPIYHCLHGGHMFLNHLPTDFASYTMVCQEPYNHAQTNSCSARIPKEDSVHNPVFPVISFVSTGNQDPMRNVFGRQMDGKKHPNFSSVDPSKNQKTKMIYYAPWC